MVNKIKRDNSIKRIAVIGMGRSGTSILTQLLNNCGVYTGNSSTKYEHPVGRKINDLILEEMFEAKKVLPYGRLPNEEIEPPTKWQSEVSIFIKQMDIIVSESCKNKIWAFKDPRTTILHKLWLNHFDIVIGIFRNPAHVIESYMAKKWINGFWKRRKALEYWKRFNQSLILVNEQLNDKKPTYIFDFNADMKNQFINMCKLTGIKVDERALSDFDETRGKPKNSSIKNMEVVQIYEKLKSIRNLI